MNYPLKDAIINFVKYKDANSLAYLVKEQIDHYPKKALDALMNIISTHDTPRLLTVVGGENPAGKSKSQLANLFITKENMEIIIVFINKIYDIQNCKQTYGYGFD